MSMCSFLVWKNACLNYREFDLEGDLVGVPHSWCLSAQSFIRLLKLVWREYDIVAMNEWKTKCVGLQWTWVSKRTVFHLSKSGNLGERKFLLWLYPCRPISTKVTLLPHFLRPSNNLKVECHIRIGKELIFHSSEKYVHVHPGKMG